eukprot:631552-Pyramimonas_sp.AAC.1
MSSRGLEATAHVESWEQVPLPSSGHRQFLQSYNRGRAARKVVPKQLLSSHNALSPPCSLFLSVFSTAGLKRTFTVLPRVAKYKRPITCHVISVDIETPRTKTSPGRHHHPPLTDF